MNSTVYLSGKKGILEGAYLAKLFIQTPSEDENQTKLLKYNQLQRQQTARHIRLTRNVSHCLVLVFTHQLVLLSTLLFPPFATFSLFFNKVSRVSETGR